MLFPSSPIANPNSPGPSEREGPRLVSLYDDDGNLVSDGMRTFAWDAENRLISVTPDSPEDGSLRVGNAYDWALVVSRWQNRVKTMAGKYSSIGYKTIAYFNHSNRSDFVNAWNTEGIAGVFYAGHGGDAGLTMNALTEDMVFPDEVSPPYKLSVGHFYACESKMIYNRQKWQEHFAIDYGADFVGFSGKAYLWTKVEGPDVLPSITESNYVP